METDEADDEEEVQMLAKPASKFVGGNRRIQKRKGEPSKAKVKISKSSEDDGDDPFDADTSFLREDVSDMNLSDVMEQMNCSMEEYKENQNRPVEKMMEDGRPENFPLVSSDIEALLAGPTSPEASGRPEASLSDGPVQMTPPAPGSMPSLCWTTTTVDSGRSSEDLNEEVVIKNFERKSFINKFSMTYHFVDRLQNPLAMLEKGSQHGIIGNPGLLAPEIKKNHEVTIHVDFTISPNLSINIFVFIIFNRIIPELMNAQCVPVVPNFDME